MPPFAGPKPRRLIGHLAAFRADRLKFFTECARTYGDVVPLKLPGRRLLLLSDPDLIERVLVTQAKHFIKHFGLRMYKPILGEGLVTSEGLFWRRQRKLAAPAFHPGRLPGYSRPMAAAAAGMLDEWKRAIDAAGGGRAVGGGGGGGDGAAATRDVHADMMKLTLDIACRTFFGADACPDPHIVGDAMHDALAAIEVRFGRLIPIPDWFPTPSNLRLRKAKRTLDGVVRGIVARRRADAAGSDGDDFLSTLLRATAEDGSRMTDAQLLDEVRTVFLAGHETTALALTYALHLLAENADAQGALHAELAARVGNRPAAYEDLDRLPFARGVVMESLRLYPPADVLGREAIEDVQVGDVLVTRGTSVFMSQWVMHRDPRFFPNPLAFDPGRWTEPFERSLPRFAYFPFGGGPRYCIGQAFAIAEAMLLLATICQRFAFAPDPTFRLQLWPTVTLRPRDGLRLRVMSRQ